MSPQRILIIAEGQLGDLLLLTPALGALKSTFPSCSLSVLIVSRRGTPPESPTPTRPVLGPLQAGENNPLATDNRVDNLYVIHRPFLRSLHGILRFKAELNVVAFLRKARFDTVVCTFPEDRFALYAYFSGAKVRVGQRDQPLRWLLTRTPAISKSTRGVRAYYCDLVRAIGAMVSSEKTRYQVSAELKRWASSALRKEGVRKGDTVVLVHPGATGEYKIWPPENFASLVDKLRNIPRTKVLLCGAPGDRTIVTAIRRRLRSELIDVDTGGDIGRLAALMEHSHLCITNDSGPRHLAVAVGAPSLALFRRYHDREWKIYDEGLDCATLQGKRACPACPVGQCLDNIPQGEKFGSHCIRMITVAEVLRQTTKMLRRA